VQCNVAVIVQHLFTTNVVFTFITISVERAYSSYKVGRYENLDIHKAHRPVIYAWIVTLVWTLSAEVSNLLRGVYNNDSWNTQLPLCEEVYAAKRQYFIANQTAAVQQDILKDRKNYATAALVICAYFTMECVPLLLFIYVARRNRKLLDTFVPTDTHKSIVARVMLQRNIVATQV
jgi:hypothetical protein